MKHLRTFAALGWYEETITFLFTFTAKTSEVLLAAGLVVSTANFLTDGTVMGQNDQLATAWAWAQAFAIDSGLGITFFSVFTCLKQRDWLKATLYGVLTLLLAVVAGTITNIDTFSHALHTSIASATAQVGLDLKVLTTLRAIAVVGFVMMSRLKQVSFKDLHASEPSDKTALGSASSEPVTPANQTTMELESGPQEPSFPDELAPLEGTSLSTTELVHLLQILVQQHGTTISEEQHALLSVTHAPGADTLFNDVRATSEPEPRGLAEETQEEREARIERAYLELKAEGKRISGRSLAARAHIHRSTCNQWLESYQQRTDSGVPEEDEQGGAEAPLT